jgi:site-specific DNA-methyltransferase (adenine-specific)
MRNEAGRCRSGPRFRASHRAGRGPLGFNRYRVARMSQVERIGRATLHLGDCLGLMSSAIPAMSAAACITDPPYGINTKSDGQGKLSPWGDLCNSAYWYAEWIKAARSRLRPDGCLWSCLNWRSMVTFQKASCDLRWPIESMLVWDKRWIGPGGQKGLRPSYEMVALFAGDEFSIDNRGLPDIQAFKWSGLKPTGHPAEKPVGLMSFLVENSTKPDDLVFDPFLGSGTTGVAAVQAGRDFIGFEQDEAWFEFACRRIEQAQSQGSLFGEAA